jgi:sRNA-binding carbon storage regulator CsrA
VLCLTRGKEEVVVIHLNGTIIATITVLDGFGKVKLGCVAQENIGIDRAEVFNKMHPHALAAYLKQTAKN